MPIASFYFVIVPKDLEGEPNEEDAVDNQKYVGPLAEHDAKTALEGMEKPSDFMVANVQLSGGSLTALPIIETLLGDVSAYIPTNVISITDGQIYLEADLFNAGIRPAINVGLSVSRVGGDARSKAMNQVAGQLRLDMASYREVAAFALFASDLDAATQAQLAQGQRLQEILKQPQFEPLELEEEVVAIFAGTEGYADKVPVDKVSDWERALLRNIESTQSELLSDIAAKKEITTDTETQLREAIETFMRGWQD